MAKAKEAKQRITDFLKAKNLDAAEIKDVFEGLDALDADLELLTEALDKNRQWNDWYQKVVPTVQTTMQEYASLKAQVDRLRQAGVNFGTEPPNAAPTQAAAQGFDPDAFKTQITGATSSLMKDVAKYGIRHLQRYNEELDYDAVEKIMQEKSVPFELAYKLYEEPKLEEKRNKDFDARVKQATQEALQNELSKQGIRASRKKVDDVEAPPISEVIRQDATKVPSTSELRSAWLKDMDEQTH